MKKRLHGILRLTRCKEFTSFTAVTTLLGVAAGDGHLGWRLVGVLVGNWLAVGFAFMINDVEDAPDDALAPGKAVRNPVSSGDLTEGSARRASFAVAALAAAVYSQLGLWPLVFGLCCLLLGQLYSWRRVRLKRVPVLDLVSHALMLAGLQFLTGLFAFSPGYSARWVIPFAGLVAVSMYGELFNEVRDREADLKAGLAHTANLLGPTASQVLMAGFMATAAGMGLVTFIVQRLVPIPALLGALVLSIALMVPRLLKVRRGDTAIELQSVFQKPLEIGGALSLGALFVWPWLAPRLSLVLQWWPHLF